MSTYTSTVTTDEPVAKKLAATGKGIITGTINISVYSQTRLSVGLSKFFRTDPTVLLGGSSSNGYIVSWDSTNKSVKAWYPSGGFTPTGTLAAVTSTSVSGLTN